MSYITLSALTCICTLVNANLAIFLINAKMWSFQEFNNDIIPATGKPVVTVSHM